MSPALQSLRSSATAGLESKVSTPPPAGGEGGPRGPGLPLGLQGREGGLPPGLANREGGMPPGLAMQMEGGPGSPEGKPEMFQQWNRIFAPSLLAARMQAGSPMLGGGSFSPEGEDELIPGMGGRVGALRRAANRWGG